MRLVASLSGRAASSRRWGKRGDRSPHCYVNVKSQLSQRGASSLFVLLKVFSFFFFFFFCFFNLRD
jgi:hypothetical protein